MADNFILQYPDDGGKFSGSFGIHFIDFLEGKVTEPDGTKVTLKRNLKNSKQDFIRSLAIFISDTAKITLGRGQGVQSYLSSYGWNLFENINIKEIQIETFTAGVPDVNEIIVIGSTSSKSIYIPKDIVHHQQDKKAAQTTTDAYATNFFKVTDKFVYNTFVIDEDGTNSITYKVLGRQTGTATAAEIQGDTVLSNAQDIINITGSWSILEIQIKATVGAAQGAVITSWSGHS